MKIALVSYNIFLEDEDNGWKTQGDNSIFLLQNSGHGYRVCNERFGAPQGEQRDAKDSVDLVQGLINRHWQILSDILSELDHVVVYVGTHGAEKAIELAHVANLDPQKMSFVLCDCKKAVKLDLLKRFGFAGSRKIDCECGGQESMRRIYHRVFDGVKSIG